MSWKEFLVFADGSEDGVARLRMAMDIAKAHDGRLEALVLSPIPAAFPMGGDVLASLDDATRREVLKTGEDTVKLLRDAAGPSDKLHIHAWTIAQGDSQSAAARAARSADLAIFGQPEEMDGSRLDTDIFLGAVLEGGRPCLMLPRWIKPHAWGKRALIIWKGTPEASRALQAALPFLVQAEAVRLCAPNPRGHVFGEDQEGLARIAAYLMRHGVKVEEPVMRESWEGSEYMLPSEIDSFRADFLVFGAYEGSRVVEDLFGGVTAKMVREARIPIVMAR
ncbi:MAG: universal stress protein [Hyphomonadaceae bacterium]|nr:universal stress protein [Hyphomonadaceae bacterium]